jgi:predicted transcriptional regulator
MVHNINCIPVLKEKFLKILKFNKWKTLTQIATALDLPKGTVSQNIEVLVHEGVVARKKVGKQVAYRLSGKESVFEPKTGSIVIEIKPDNYPQFYVEKLVEILKKHYLNGITCTVTLIVS